MRLTSQGKTVFIASLIAFLFAAYPCYAQSHSEIQSMFQTELNQDNINHVLFTYAELEKQQDFYFKYRKRDSFAINDTLDNRDEDRKTTSLTAGYISDVFNIQNAEGSYRFRFDGELTGLMLSSRSSLLMLSYGFSNAWESDGDVRSINADLQLGGNITLFDRFLGLPLRTYLPVRFNFGYRNLELVDATDTGLNNTANIGSGSIGGGFGGELRIPTGLPVVDDNISAFANLVTSVGVIGDMASYLGAPEPGETVLGGIRLTKSTDLNIEAKFERLLGENTGVTAGVTMRWLHWTRNDAENAKQILDIISGREDSLELRGTQTFFRVGINW